MALNPKWVHMDRLTSGRNAAAVTLPDTPTKDAPTHNPDHPLYAIYGQDPRTEASAELGGKNRGRNRYPVGRSTDPRRLEARRIEAESYAER